jgi:hypothetical protein
MALRLVLVLLAATVAVVLAACGGQEESSADKFPAGDRRAIAQTVEDLQRAGERGDAKRICRDLLAASVVRRIAGRGGTCERALEPLLEDADNFQLSVQRVTVLAARRGAPPRASARVKSAAEDETRFDTFTLVKERGRWRVESLGGT